MKTLPQIIHQIQSLKELKDFVLVAIDGRGGSGKSTLANYIKGRIPHVRILPIDDFLHSGLLKPELKRLRQEVLIPLKNGEPATYRKYNWESQELANIQNIQPEGVLIVEGVYSLSSALAHFFDYKIWIEYPADLALARGLKRDREEYKVETGKYWDAWIIQEKEYIEEENPQAKADSVVDGTV